MADLLHINLSSSFILSSLSSPLNYSPHRPFSFICFSPLNRRFSHSSSLLAKLSSDSSQFDIISRSENSDGSVSFKFGDVTEISPTADDGESLDDQSSVVTNDESDGGQEEFARNGAELKEIVEESVDSESDVLNNEVENSSGSAEDNAVNNDATSSDSVGDDALKSDLRLSDERINNSSSSAKVEISSALTQDALKSGSNSNATVQVQNLGGTAEVELKTDLAVTAEVENSSDSVDEELDSDSISVTNVEISSDSVDDELDIDSISIAEVKNSNDSFKEGLHRDSVSIAEVENLSDSVGEELDSDSISIVGVANSSDVDTIEYENQIVDNAVTACDSSGGVMVGKGDELREASEVINDSDRLEHDDELSITGKTRVDVIIENAGDSTMITETSHSSVEEHVIEDSNGTLMSEHILKKGKEDMVGLMSKQLEMESLDQEDEDTAELMSKHLEPEPVIEEDEESSSVSLDGVLVLDSNKVQGIMTYTSAQHDDEYNDTLVAVHPVTSGITVAETNLGSLSKEESFAPALSISSAVASLSHSLEALTGGKDASFVSNNWFGVADGVGQWSFGGIDVGLYAHELMQNCVQLLTSESAGLTNVKKLLQKSVAMTRSTGSARVLIAHVANQVLHVANVGDSGFLIIRNGTVFRKSSPMIHEFSFPYAIGLGDDSVEDVEEYHIELDEGDLIITATDGLFDNLYDQEIASIVSKSMEAGMHLQDLAELLASKAQEVGRSESARSPFADAAQAAGHPEFIGGKFDHVTVIVSLVQR